MTRIGDELNIILVSGNLGKVRTLTLSGSRLAMLATALVFGLVLVAAGAQYMLLRHAAQMQSPLVWSLFGSAAEEQQRRTESYLRENLNTMAIRVGQMQAQLLRLDSLGERLAKLSGIKPQEFFFDQVPGRGGAAPAWPLQDLSMSELSRQVEDLALGMDDRFTKLGVLESVVMQDQVTKKMLPTMLPIENGWYASNFGWRIDPFSGKNAFHEGVDFNAEPGTPVLAAAGGIVVFSDYHPEYGNMIEIDHGNDLLTRYAHASRRLVSVGEVVLRGQKIAEVGNTGRSTGAHLHFEIRDKGVPKNPARFLQARN
jgi:murein DD-endopeptidase MepM/ murein hydrolase activator NlpD